MREAFLAALSQYGSPVLFGVVLIASIGVPLPVTLVLIVAGSLVAQGFMSIGPAIVLASAGSIIGDQIGYVIGRWGGNAVIRRLTRLLSDKHSLETIQEKTARWGGPGIFFTRWVLGVLGPWVNLACGAARYPWMRFLAWDVAGEVIGAVVYIWLGREFSDRVLAIDSLLGDFSWALLAFLAAIALGWKLLSYARRQRSKTEANAIASGIR
jgi:membrane-associated protein